MVQGGIYPNNSVINSSCRDSFNDDTVHAVTTGEPGKNKEPIAGDILNFTIEACFWFPCLTDGPSYQV